MATRFSTPFGISIEYKNILPVIQDDFFFQISVELFLVSFAKPEPHFYPETVSISLCTDLSRAHTPLLHGLWTASVASEGDKAAHTLALLQTKNKERGTHQRPRLRSSR